jgi:glycosyltransferase involved in cell wall biosynthesis
MRPAGVDDATLQKVVVLMSTYNGEQFVTAQLRSILAQLPEDARVFVRDDGSTDATLTQVLAVKDDRVRVDAGHNLGFGASFLTLLSQVPSDAQLVLFADQDDIWLPGKIERAARHLLALGEQPALYGSAQMLVTADLRPLHATPPWPRRPSLTNALTENIITGCTAAINRSAVALLQRAGVPDGVHFHDWWLYLVVSAFGTVVYDDEPTLLYRQHGRNVIGHGAGWFGRQRGVLRFLLRNDWVGILQRQVGAFLEHYGESLPPPTMAWIRRYFGGAAGTTAPRWRLVFAAFRWRQAFIGDIALRLLLTAHKLRLWPLPGQRL